MLADRQDTSCPARKVWSQRLQNTFDVTRSWAKLKARGIRSDKAVDFGVNALHQFLDLLILFEFDIGIAKGVTKGGYRLGRDGALKPKDTAKKLRAKGHDPIPCSVRGKKKKTDVLQMVLLQLRNVLLKWITISIEEETNWFNFQVLFIETSNESDLRAEMSAAGTVPRVN